MRERIRDFLNVFSGKKEVPKPGFEQVVRKTSEQLDADEFLQGIILNVRDSLRGTPEEQEEFNTDADQAYRDGVWDACSAILFHLGLKDPSSGA